MKAHITKAYKVIDKETQTGSNAAIFRQSCGTTVLLDTIKNNNLEPYFPKYSEGCIIKKVPHSPGIMAFETTTNAVEFQCRYNIEDFTEIVQVEGVLCKDQKRYIYSGVGSYLETLVRRESQYKIYPPMGTVFFDWVRVRSRVQ